MPHEDDTDLAPPGSGCIFGPGPAQTDAPDVEPGEPLGYLVKFGHGDRAGLQFHQRDADAQARFIGNGATVIPLVAEADVVKLRDELATAIQQRDLAHRGCLCDDYGARGHHGACPARKVDEADAMRAYHQQHRPLDTVSAAAAMARAEALLAPNPEDLCGFCGRLRREHGTRHDTCTRFQEPT